MSEDWKKTSTAIKRLRKKRARQISWTNLKNRWRSKARLKYLLRKCLAQLRQLMETRGPKVNTLLIKEQTLHRRPSTKCSTPSTAAKLQGKWAMAVGQSQLLNIISNTWSTKTSRSLPLTRDSSMSTVRCLVCQMVSQVESLPTNNCSKCLWRLLKMLTVLDSEV